MRWLILVPYYFFAALALLPFLMVLARLLRLKVAINTLVAAAIVIAFAGILLPLACHWVGLSSFTGRLMLLLGLLSFVWAAADAALAKWLPAPFDSELQEL